MNNKLLIIFILSILLSTKAYSQLNEFMVGWYFNDLPRGNQNPLTLNFDWGDPYSNLNVDLDQRRYFFNRMRNYGFNTFSLLGHYYSLETDGWAGQYPEFNDRNGGIKTSCGTYLSKQILEDANLFGLKAILTAYEINAGADITEKSCDVNEVNSAIDYYNNSNVIGFDIGDEPKSIEPGLTTGWTPTNPKISDIVDYANAMRNKNPNLLRWSNLQPSYTAKNNFDYREKYLQKYIDLTNPNILSFDEYPNMDYERTFFQTLYDFASKSVENSIPFFYVLTPFNEVWKGSPKSIQTFRYDIFSALAYGAKGLNYWPGFEWAVYGGPDHPYTQGDYPFKLSYNPTTYSDLAIYHKTFTDNSNILLDLNFASAYHLSTLSTIIRNNGAYINEVFQYNQNWNHSEGQPNRPGFGIDNDEYAKFVFDIPTIPFELISNKEDMENNGDVYKPEADRKEDFAVTFMTNSNNEIFFWILNKNIIYGHNIKLLFNMNNVEYVTDVLNDPDEKIYPNDPVWFYVGMGKLFKVTKVDPNSRITERITNTTYASNSTFMSPLVTADNIFIGNGANFVTFESGTYSSFMAHKIIIGKGVKMLPGCHIKLKKYTNSNTISSNVTLRSMPEKSIDNQPTKKPDIKIFTTPNMDEFNIFVDMPRNEITTIRIFNIFGRNVKNVDVNSGVNNISLAGEASGVYIVNLRIDGKQYNYKFLKK